MVRATLAIQVLTLALAAALPSWGQQAAEQAWHLSGVLGADFSQDTLGELFVPSGSQGASGYSSIAGDLGLSLGGYLKDPKLLPFTIDFNGEHGSNDVALGGYRNNVYAVGASATFLPDRPFPFHVFYRKDEFGTVGTGFNENSDTSTFGFDWSLRVHRLPHVNVRYLKESNEVQLVTSIAGSSYRLNEFGFNVSDKWKGWDWRADFTDYSTTNNAVAAVSLSSPFGQSLKAQTFFVNHTFWDDKAWFSFADRVEWEQNEFQGQSTGQFTDVYATAALDIRHTPKLSSNYYYSFTSVSSSGETSLTATNGTSSNVSLVQLPTFTSDSFGGGVRYQLTPSLGIFQELQEYRVTAVESAGAPEAETSETDSLSGASLGKAWRGFDLNLQYTGHLQILSTTLGHHPTTFSNDVEGRVGWGNPRRVRLVASGVDTRYNLVDELGGFTGNQNARLQAESARFLGWYLRGTVERARLEYLSTSGDIKSDTTNFAAQIEKRRLAFSGGHQILTGWGALFPAIVSAQTWLSIPLPLSELVATPLLNRLSHIDTATAALHLRRNFDVSADYMSERDVLATSKPAFRTVDVSARYHVGKLGIRAGFGEYRIENSTLTVRTGTLLNRYFVQVTRDFKIF